MKLFLDTANIKEIREANALGVLDGVTTNPTLVGKEGREFGDLIAEICSIVKGPVSAEVVSTDCEGMLEEADRLVRIAPNVVVKVPLIPEGLKALKILSQRKVRVNVTLCFSPVQALLVAKCGASYISPFIGRLDDISEIGMDVVRDIKTIYANYSFQTETLVASVRHPVHVLEAAKLGADIATMPFDVFQKLIKHPLTDIGLQRFLSDWEKAKKTLVQPTPSPSVGRR